MFKYGLFCQERERLFELELRRAKGFEVKKMLEDGNCLFRAVADQVYGDPEAYDMARQMCVDYMVCISNPEKCHIRISSSLLLPLIPTD